MIPLTQRLVSKSFRQRLVWIRIGFLLIVGIIVIRALHLQLVERSRLNKIADNRNSSSVAVKLRRGPIYDADGKILAVSLPLQSIFAVPREIEDPVDTAKQLSRELNLPRDQLEKKLSSDISFTWIKRNAKPRVSDHLRRIKLEGIHFLKEYQRFYPMGNHAAHIIGFSGIDSQGLEGIEYKFNSHLMDNTGLAGVWNYFYSKPSLKTLSGGSLHLTIHSKLQYYTEKELKKAVTATKAKNAIAIIMESKTGKILSLANIPDYDPNNFDRYDSSRFFNRAVNATYEPGSTFKVITVATALEYEVVQKGSIFDCQQGEYQIQDRVIHDVAKYGWLPLEMIIQKSSNICAAKIGQRIPRSLFYKSIRDFGFGAPTGIELPGEVTGKVHNYQNWSDTDVATMSFGHTISATPIQVLTAINTIATGGSLVKPSIIQAAFKSDGTQAHQANQGSRQIIKQETAATLKSFMESVTRQGGTGHLAGIKGISIAGKTGTSRKFDIRKREYSRTNHISSFIGFFPSEDPELTILVVIDEPQKEYLGSKGPAPIFKKIAQHALRFYPETKARALDKQQASPSEAGFFQAADSRQISFDTVTDIPSAFRGLTLRQALVLADKLNLRINPIGTGKVRQVRNNGNRKKVYTLILK